MLPSALKHALTVDDVMTFIVACALILFSIVIGSMVYFVFKYNRKRHPRAENIEGNLVLEIAWVAIPTMLALAMFYFGYQGFAQMRRVPKDAMPIKVIGRQWSWTFEYENGKRADTAYVPLGKPIKFLVTSVDVIHSFYIPAFREKQDAIPGSIHYMMLYPEQLGSYDVACAEYCGLNHAMMYTKLVVVTPQEFQKWVNTNVGLSKPVTSGSSGPR
ncbi:MAG: cytochrome c oxidase subunit II [Bacteroidota bacterium]